MDKKKVAFHTLGCKLNFSESSTLARNFEESGGFERVSNHDHADIHVINSCSVTETSDKKCRALIRKIAKEDKEAIIVVTGCYAQLKAEEIAKIEGVDIVVGNNSKGKIVEMTKGIVEKGKAKVYSCEREGITSFFSSFSSGDRTRAFLKVQDGCNYFCSYCTIPLARGASRNAPISEVVAQAHQIAAKNLKEVVITGINSGDFGRSTGETFFDLIKELDSVDGIERYRISSIEPNLLTDEIIEFCASSTKFQPHFHIPLQSGCDDVLKLMRRRYTTSLFRSKIERIREVMGDVFFGIDVIVGFPSESEAQFEETYNFLESIAPAHIHVFPYSERPNTDAINFEGKVSQTDKNHRVKRLTELSERLYKEYCAKYVGLTLKVLVEGSAKGGVMFGHTQNYIKVEMPYSREAINTIVDVKIESIEDDGRVVASLIKGTNN